MGLVGLCRSSADPSRARRGRAQRESVCELGLPRQKATLPFLASHGRRYSSLPLAEPMAVTLLPAMA